MKTEKKTRTPPSLNIRKARAQDKLDALEAWRKEQLVTAPEYIKQRHETAVREATIERDAAIANVPAVVGVKFQEKYVRLVSTFDEDVREALKAEV